MQRHMVRVGMVGTLVGFGIVSLAYGQASDQLRSRQKISLMESVLERDRKSTRLNSSH